MERAKDEEVDVKQLGIKGASYVGVINRIRNCFEFHESLSYTYTKPYLE